MQRIITIATGTKEEQQKFIDSLSNSADSAIPFEKVEEICSTMIVSEIEYSFLLKLLIFLKLRSAAMPMFSSILVVYSLAFLCKEEEIFVNAFFNFCNIFFNRYTPEK